MAIEFVGATTHEPWSSMMLPTGTSTGDILLFMGPVGLPPSGWTVIGTQTWGQYRLTAHLSYRLVADIATEPNPIPGTGIDDSGAGYSVVAAFRGVDKTNPIDSSVVFDQSLGGPTTLPAITITTGGAMITSLCGRRTYPLTAADSMTPVYINSSIGTTGRSSVFTRSAPTAGVYSSSLHSGAGSYDTAIYGVALRPAISAPAARPWSRAQIIE